MSYILLLRVRRLIVMRTSLKPIPHRRISGYRGSPLLSDCWAHFFLKLYLRKRLTSSLFYAASGDGCSSSNFFHSQLGHMKTGPDSLEERALALPSFSKYDRTPHCNLKANHSTSSFIGPPQTGLSYKAHRVYEKAENYLPVFTASQRARTS